MAASIIVADRVTKVFEEGRRDEVVALKDLSLEVTEGEFLCLVGGSGCGK
ncbi:MAG: ATP-binding protein, partial [Candidatus Rokuibacteriota bacterium]